MTEEQIITFMKVAELGSFNKAAEALNITQPAVTHRIKLLEEDVGAKLFDRSSSSTVTVLTQSGTVMLGKCEKMIKLFEETRNDVRTIRKTSYVFGCSARMLDGGSYLHYHIMSVIAPKMNVSFTAKEYGRYEKQQEKILNGEFDFIFTDTAADDWADDRFDHIVRSEYQAVACVHSKNPLAKKGKITVEDLVGQQLYWEDDNTFFPRRSRKYLLDCGCIEENTHLTSLREASLKLRPEKGVLLLSHNKPIAGDIKIIPLDWELRQQVGIVWLREKENEEFMKIIEMIASFPPDYVTRK